MQIGPPMRRPAETDARRWVAALAPYRESSLGRSLAELFVTVVPFVALWLAMLLGLRYSFWLCLLLAVPPAGFLVRLFMIQHDCGHGGGHRGSAARGGGHDSWGAARHGPLAPGAGAAGALPGLAARSHGARESGGAPHAGYQSLIAPCIDRRVKAFAANVLCMGALTACSTGGMPFCDGASQDSADSGSYSLGSGDRLEIVVFRHPDLSGEFALDGDGYLALPLLGEIAAGGLTTSQLEEAIETQLKADDLLVSPHVGVQVATYRSFYVVGEVGAPGGYEYRSGITVISAVALAGGYTPRADRSSATIGRGGCRLATQADTFVKPGDILTVAERFF